METINPKSMFTKGQTAYSIALLSYKDDRDRENHYPYDFKGWPQLRI